MNFRIRKGTHVSHFHEKCPRWPRENFYEQDKPLWWGNLCEECSKLADIEATQKERKSGSDPDSHADSESRIDFNRKAGTGC
jgi:hypothetical protein